MHTSVMAGWFARCSSWMPRVFQAGYDVWIHFEVKLLKWSPFTKELVFFC